MTANRIALVELSTLMISANQLEFQSRTGGGTQCDNILAALQSRRGQWVPMTDLWRASGAFAVHSRIADLRKRGHAIEHRNEHHEGVVHSFYRLNLGAEETHAA
jgi:hypothetical protein